MNVPVRGPARVTRGRGHCDRSRAGNASRSLIDEVEPAVVAVQLGAQCNIARIPRALSASKTYTSGVFRTVGV